MTINWKQPESKSKLLAAVFAEFGEQAFKGRYGRIAQWYGPEATYDAIKSYFAKEVAKAAGELTLESPDQHDRRQQSRQRQTPHAPPPRLIEDLEEDEIQFVSERELKTSASRPARQLPIEGLSALFRGAANGSSQGDRYSTSGDHANTPNVAAFTMLRTPNPIPRGRGRAVGRAGRQQQRMSRKRPHSAIQDLIADDLDDSNGQPSRGGSAAPQLRSFGYFADNGSIRCALCSTNLSSQESLQKHESQNKLHLENLKNPTMVSKGRISLTRFATTSRIEMSPPNPPPEEVADTGNRVEAAASGSASQSTIRATSHTVGIDRNTHQNFPSDGTLPQDQSMDLSSRFTDHDLVNTEIISFTAVNPSQTTDKDKGKGRAQSLPRQPQSAPATTSHPGASSQIDLTAEPGPNSSTEVGVAVHNRGRPNLTSEPAAGTTTTSSAPVLPTELRIFLETGRKIMNGIETHPEWVQSLSEVNSSGAGGTITTERS